MKCLFELQLLLFEQLVEYCINNPDYCESSTDNGTNGGHEVVPLPAPFLDHHTHGGQSVGEAGLRNLVSLVVHHLGHAEHLVAIDSRAHGLVVGAYHLDEVVEGLVVVRVHVHVVVHGRHLGVLFRHTLDDGGLAGVERGAERQLVHHVGQVGHRRVKVVVLGAGLQMEVSGHTVHVQVAHQQASDLVLVVREAVSLQALFHLVAGQLGQVLVGAHQRVGVAAQRLDRAVPLVVGEVWRGAHEEAQGGEGADVVLLAKVAVCRAVHRGDREPLVVFSLLGFSKLLPSRSQSLAPHAPWGIKVDEGKLVLCYYFRESVRVQRPGMDSILVEFLKILIMLLQQNISLFFVSSTEHFTNSTFIQVPLFNVLCDVHFIRSENI
mmetsp:Transcript_5586/g.8458  ORF Transcript_5586/g.8458 Transcript_5586/m.8458 type:complete len:379 (+) Transcript_5586:199-1335(+)